MRSIPSRHHSRKHNFTFFEVLLVLLLLSLVLGGIGFAASRLLKGETFEKSVTEVISKISLCQELMLDYHTDVILELTQKEKGISCLVTPLKAVPEKILKAINRDLFCKGIESVCFGGEKRGRITLLFQSAEDAIPCGELLLRGGENAVSLSLPGFPRRIQRGKNEVKEKKEATYPSLPSA